MDALTGFLVPDTQPVSPGYTSEGGTNGYDRVMSGGQAGISVQALCCKVETLKSQTQFTGNPSRSFSSEPGTSAGSLGDLSDVVGTGLTAHTYWTESGVKFGCSWPKPAHGCVFGV